MAKVIAKAISTLYGTHGEVHSDDLGKREDDVPRCLNGMIGLSI
jgi:hypothetical protein